MIAGSSFCCRSISPSGCLSDIAASSLDVEIWAYINSADYTHFLKIKQNLLMKVMDVVETHGSAFAKPSQTTYLAQDRAPGAPFSAEALRSFFDVAAAKG